MKTTLTTALLFPLLLPLAAGQSAEPERARMTALAVEGDEFLLQGPAGHPGVLLIGEPATQPHPMRGARLAYSLDLGYFKVDKAVRDNTLRAVDAFRDLGCRVEHCGYAPEKIVAPMSRREPAWVAEKIPIGSANR